uniref:EamA domain-containing protein n=1 Tax=candidate division WOR-3 bacterium TaxID=2052148 RepID=A0A7C3J5F0_UNCW3
MFYLLLSIVSSVLIGNLLKLFQKDKNSSIYLILLSNYFVASLISFFQLNGVKVTFNLFDIIFAIFIGILYFLNFVIYDKNIKENGISLSISIMRVSLVIPLILSIFLFKEKFTINLCVGVILIIIAFMLMGNLKGKISLFLIFLLFLNTGISDAGLKIFEVFGKNNISFFLFILFLSAFLINLIVFLIRDKKFYFKSILYGFFVGIPNQFMSYFFIKSLKQVQASVAYPLLGGGVVLGGILTDIIFWKARPNLKQYIIFFLLIVGVIFLNLK